MVKIKFQVKTYAPFIFIIILMLLCSPVASLINDSITISSTGTMRIFTRPLHVDGRYIKDDLNNTIILRGVNHLGHWQREGYPVYDGYGTFNEDALRYQLGEMTLNWGINCIREQLAVEDIMNNIGIPNRDQLRRLIEIAGEYDVYVILSAFRLSGSDWVRGRLPFPMDYDGDGVNEYEIHPEIIPDMQTFINFWVDFAADFSDLPNWLIDPYNEPFHTNSGDNLADKAAWFEAVAGIIEGVRVYCDNIILVQWYQGEWYSESIGDVCDEFLSYLEQRGPTENLALSTHNYHDHFVHYRTWETVPNTLEQLRLDYEHNGLAYAATQVNYPLIVGEVGAQNTVVDWEQEKIWFNNTLTLYNEWGLSYLGWTWRPFPDTYGLLSESNNEYWDCSPSDSGQIFIDAIKRGR